MIQLEFNSDNLGSISANWLNDLGGLLNHIGTDPSFNSTTVFVLYLSSQRQPVEMSNLLRRLYNEDSQNKPTDEDFTITLNSRLRIEYHNKTDMEHLTELSKHYCREVLGVLESNEPKSVAEWIEYAEVILFPGVETNE